MTAVITAASWDGAGLGATVRWGDDVRIPAGSYFALTDAEGRFHPSEMIRLGVPGGGARTAWDGAVHQAVWLEPYGDGVDLWRASLARGSAASRRALVDLPAGAATGGWMARSGGLSALCTLEPGGALRLRRFGPSENLAPVDLSMTGQRMRGACHLAASGSSFLVTGMMEPRADGADALSGTSGKEPLYDAIVGRVVDNAGRSLAVPLFLSGYPGIVRVESTLWDGTRYLILINPVSTRGGRLALSAVDGAGGILFRDLELPLDYEPGVLVAGRLLARPSEYFLFFSFRRPWDSGVLYLARFKL